MTTYLGLRPSVAIATGLTAVVVGATIGLTIPTPDPAPCGLTVEEGVVMPASCASEAELADRLATIRAERSGGRFTR